MSQPPKPYEIQKLLKDLEDDQDKKNVRTSSTWPLFQRIWKQKHLLLIGMLMMVISSLAAVYEPRLLGNMIDQAILPKNSELLKDFVLAYFGLQVLRVTLMIGDSYIFSWLGQKVMHGLREELFEKIQKLPVSTFNAIPVGKLVTRVANDISSLADMFTAGFVTILGNIIMTLGTVGWLIYLHPKLGLISISVFPFLIWASHIFTAKLRVAYRVARNKLSALNAFLAENILGMKVITIFSRQKSHLDKFLQLNREYAVAQFGSVKIFALFQPSITMATGISMALVVYYGGLSTINGELQLGFLVTYFAYVLSLFQPVREVADKWNIFLAGMASVDRIFSILNWPEEKDIHDIESQPEPYKIIGDIEFQNVWFAYNEEKWILKDFTFQIRAGEKIGLVGPTGSGKTTLINLLLRFYEPQKGTILIDGVDIRNYDKRRLRASIGLIQQDVFLFSGSLKDNITIGRMQNVDWSNWLNEMSTLQRLKEKNFEDTQFLQERGGNLSMGERQVIAFSRALYGAPCLWVMDEATSNMDSTSESELENALRTHCRGRTVIVIAHRLSTIKDADQILVLQNGVLREHGSHKSLSKMDGLYKRMLQLEQHFG